MLDKNIKILSIVEDINRTIDVLLEQGGTIIAPVEGDVPVRKQKFIVVNDGDEIENTDTEFYIELSEAQTYDKDVQVGDEIEIEVLDFDSADEDGIFSVLSSDEISIEDLEQVLLPGRTTIRVGGRVIKYGPRTYRKVAKAAKKAIDAKRYISRYGKKARHSICYCLSFTKDGLDADGDMDKSVFSSSIIDQPEFIQENLLTTWKYCEDKYRKDISKKDDRQETEKSCSFLDDWYKKSESLLDKMIDTLKQAYNVKGYNKELDDETKKVGEGKSVGEKISSKDNIEIKFSSDVDLGALGTPFLSGDVKKFTIKKTFNDRNNTVLLKRGSKWYVMGFSTTQIGKPQDGEYFAIYDKSTDTVKNPKGTWSGTILSYPR